MSRPKEGEFGEFYRRYVSLASGNTAAELIASHSDKIKDFIFDLPDDKADFSYATGKWSIKQLLQHMLDTERIFVYRLLWIARGGAGLLSGFDENLFADAATASHRKILDLKEEFHMLRRGTDLMVVDLTSQELSRKGEASGYPITVNALCFIIYGHNLHHLEVLKEKYGV